MSASDSDRVDWLESGCHAHMYNLLTGCYLTAEIQIPKPEPIICTSGSYTICTKCLCIRIHPAASTIRELYNK